MESFPRYCHWAEVICFEFGFCFHFLVHNLLLNFIIRLTSMTLSPLQKRPNTNTKKKTVTWNDRQLAVTKLINESSALIDVFNEVSMMLGPEMCLNQMPMNDINVIDIPKSKLDPIFNESCKDLETSLQNFRPKQHLSSAQLLALPK